MNSKGYVSRGEDRRRNGDKNTNNSQRGGYREDQTNDIYVGNIPSEFDDLKLFDLFRGYRVISVRNFTKVGCKVFAFLKCVDQEEVERVIREMNDHVVEGRQLKLRRTDRPAKPKVEESLDATESDEKPTDKRRPPLRPPYRATQKDYRNGQINGYPESCEEKPRKKEGSYRDGPPPLVLCDDRPPPLEVMESRISPVGAYSKRASSPATSHVSNNSIHSAMSATHGHVPRRAPRLPISVKKSLASDALLFDHDSLVDYSIAGCHPEPHISPVSSRCSHSSCCDRATCCRHQEHVTCCSGSGCHSTTRSPVGDCHRSTPSAPSVSDDRRRDRKRQQQSDEYADYDYDDEEDESVVLCVANFPFYTTQARLYELFEDFDPLDIDIVEDGPTDNLEDFTYALVTVPDRETAEAAIFELDNTQFGKRTIVVQQVCGEDISFEDKGHSRYQEYTTVKKKPQGKQSLSERFSRDSF